VIAPANQIASARQSPRLQRRGASAPRAGKADRPVFTRAAPPGIQASHPQARPDQSRRDPCCAGTSIRPVHSTAANPRRYVPPDCICKATLATKNPRFAENNQSHCTQTPAPWPTCHPSRPCPMPRVSTRQPRGVPLILQLRNKRLDILARHRRGRDAPTITAARCPPARAGLFPSRITGQERTAASCTCPSLHHRHKGVQRGSQLSAGPPSSNDRRDRAGKEADAPRPRRAAGVVNALCSAFLSSACQPTEYAHLGVNGAKRAGS